MTATSPLPIGRRSGAVVGRGDITPGRQGAGWERTEVEHIPPGALDDEFNEHRAEFQRLLEALPSAAPVYPREVRLAATELAARCQIAGKMRLFFGATRQDRDAAPAETARELEQLCRRAQADAEPLRLSVSPCRIIGENGRDHAWR